MISLEIEMTCVDVKPTTNLLIHVGLPKCASTSLQKLFKEEARLNYLGKWKENNSGAFFSDQKLKSFVEDDVYVMNDEEFYGAYKQGEFTHLLVPEQLNVLSEEALSGVGFRHGLSFDTYLEQVVCRLKYVFNQPFDLLLITRDFEEFIHSYYKQKVVGNYYQSFSYFLENETVLINRMNALLIAKQEGIKDILEGEYFVVDFKKLVGGEVTFNDEKVVLDLVNPSRSRMTILKKRIRNFKKRIFKK